MKRFPGSATSRILLILLALFSTGGAWADQIEIPDYREASGLLWGTLYPRGGHSLYCGLHAKSGHGFNIEHVFAASWMKDAAGCGGSSRRVCRRVSERFNHMEGDLHNLWPAKTQNNSDRANYTFGVIPGSSRSDCDFEVDTASQMVEPRPEVRGDIARTLLYMLHEYDINWQRTPIRDIDELHQWHCQDPVDDHERHRNDVIERTQGTRNPYVDRPEMITCETVEIPQD